MSCASLCRKDSDFPADGQCNLAGFLAWISQIGSIALTWIVPVEEGSKTPMTLYILC